MLNELEEIMECLYQRYTDKNHWIISKAERNLDGSWNITIVKESKPEAEDVKAE